MRSSLSVTILVTLFFFGLRSAWTADFSTGFLTRAVPFGAAAFAEMGQGILLWGESKSPGDFRYGFARIAGRFAGSGFVNRGDLITTLSPIAPVALDAGLTARRRFIREFATVDCSGAQCEGWTYGSYLRIRALLGWRSAFALLVPTFEHLRAEQPYEPFIDEQSALRAGDPHRNIPGDFRRELFWLAGWRLSATQSIGVMQQSSRMLRSEQSSTLTVLFLRDQLDRVLPSSNGWHFTLGAGTFQSSSYATGLSAILRLEWNDGRSLELR